jgi:hypothetical protein
MSSINRSLLHWGVIILAGHTLDNHKDVKIKNMDEKKGDVQIYPLMTAYLIKKIVNYTKPIVEVLQTLIVGSLQGL